MNKTHTLIKRKLEHAVSRLRRGQLNSHESVQTYTQKARVVDLKIIPTICTKQRF